MKYLLPHSTTAKKSLTVSNKVMFIINVRKVTKINTGDEASTHSVHEITCKNDAPWEFQRFRRQKRSGGSQGKWRAVS